MTLLFPLFLSYTIMTIILFEKYYINYLFSSLLFGLYPLWHHYLNYIFVILLSQLWLSHSIICIIFSPTYYLHYKNYGDENNWYNAYIWYNRNLFYMSPPCTFKWYMATDTGFNSRNAFVHIWGSYIGKNIAKSRWLVHLRFGRHTQETGI